MIRWRSRFHIVRYSTLRIRFGSHVIVPISSTPTSLRPPTFLIRGIEIYSQLRHSPRQTGFFPVAQSQIIFQSYESLAQPTIPVLDGNECNLAFLQHIDEFFQAVGAVVDWVRPGRKPTLVLLVDSPEQAWSEVGLVCTAWCIEVLIEVSSSSLRTFGMIAREFRPSSVLLFGETVLVGSVGGEIYSPSLFLVDHGAFGFWLLERRLKRLNGMAFVFLSVAGEASSSFPGSSLISITVLRSSKSLIPSHPPNSTKQSQLNHGSKNNRQSHHQQHAEKLLQSC